MKIVKSKGDFCGVKFCDGIGEPLSWRKHQSSWPLELSYDGRPYLGLSQKAEKLTTFYKIHNHVKIFCIDESAPQSDQERMLDPCQHPPLIVGMLDLFHFDNLLLLQYLNSIEALIVFRLNHMDPAKAARTQCSLEVEVLQMVFAFRTLLISSHWP